MFPELLAVFRSDTINVTRSVPTESALGPLLLCVNFELHFNVARVLALWVSFFTDYGLTQNLLS